MKTTLPLRITVPLILGLLCLLIVGVVISFDRLTSSAVLEVSLTRRAMSLSNIVAPSLERAIQEGETAIANDEISRLALEPSVALAAVFDESNRVLFSTDFRIRDHGIADTSAASSAPLFQLARSREAAQSEVARDGRSVRSAAPFLLPPLPGELRPSRVAILYLEMDLAGPKREMLASMVVRSVLVSAVSLIGCMLVWLYLRTSFLTQLDTLVERTTTGAAGAESIAGSSANELAQLGQAVTALMGTIEMEHGARQVSEQKFARVFASAPVMIALNVAPDWRFTDVNEAATRISGFSAEELKGRTAIEVGWISRDDGRRIAAAVRDHGSVANLELTAHAKDGRQVECLVFAEMLTLFGQPHILTLTQDITELKRSQAALADSERRLRHLLDNAPIAIAMGRTASLEYVNRAYAQMFGLGEPEAYLGRAFIEQVAPEGRPEFAERAARRLRGEPAEEHYEAIGLRADGTRFPVVASVTRVMLSDGPMVIGFFDDATPRRQAEQQLRESEARFRAIVENSHEAITFIDTAGRVVYRSPSADRIDGFTAADRLGQPAIANLHPDDVAATRALLDDVLAHPGELRQTEFRVRHKDGGWLTVESSVRNLLENPSVRALVVTTRDITERKRSEEERRRLESELLQAQKMEAVGRLAGGVAHDFNNMLSVILLSLEMADSMLSPEHPAAADLREIRAAAERSATLTRQLLAFARRQPAEVEPIDLNEVVESGLSMLRRLIGEHITLGSTLAPRLHGITADRGQLFQVLTNLVVNARDAIATTGAISISTRNAMVDDEFCATRPDARPGHYAVLQITDDGHGMDHETLAHIFEPFFTTKGLHAGTGLGLPTVYGIVRQHRGFIDVTSTPDKGSTFSVYWPASAVPDEPPDIRTVPDAPSHGNETILLVEDEPALLKLTTRVLQAFGYSVLAASSPAAAMELSAAHDEPIDLLLTDVVMPEMSGAELARQLSALRPSMKCLFTSGYSADQIDSHGVLEHGVDFLAKPWSNQSLAAKVRDVLDRPRAST